MPVSWTTVPPGDKQSVAVVSVVQIIVYVSVGFPGAPSAHENETDVLATMPGENELGAAA